MRKRLDLLQFTTSELEPNDPPNLSFGSPEEWFGPLNIFFSPNNLALVPLAEALEAVVAVTKGFSESSTDHIFSQILPPYILYFIPGYNAVQNLDSRYNEALPSYLVLEKALMGLVRSVGQCTLSIICKI